MVLADRGIQDIRSGRRSRAASPSGHASDGSNATDDSEHSMKVGDEYQAVIPEMISSGPCPENASENALLVWSPSTDISDAKLDEYISIAKERYGYNVEQALGMLFWHKYDMEKAIADLANFTPFPDEWTVEDKVLFEQAFQFHGKSFHKIRQMLPDKSIASLVKYYYSWKKVRSRTSLMDRQVRKLSSQKEDGSDVGSEAPSENESDMDTENKDNKSDAAKATCSNCGANAQVYGTSARGPMCGTCLKRSGLRNSAAMRTSARHNPIRSKRKPPRGMHLTYEDLVAVVTGSSGEGDAILKSMDAEIVSLRRQVQHKKQAIGQLKQTTGLGVDSFRPQENSNRINARWTNDELLIAVQALRKYGRDYKAVAETIGTKTENHVRTFYSNYRRRYNLDKVINEYEMEHGIVGEKNGNEGEKADGERDGSSSTNNSLPNSPGSASQAAPPLLHPPQSPSNVPAANNHQRLCPPPLQQAGAARNSTGGRTLLQQPPPLICPSNNFVNGSS